MSGYLAFGGPWNEQIVPVVLGLSPIFHVAEPSTELRAGQAQESSVRQMRRVRYDVHTLGYHDPTRCDAPLHSSCTFTGRVLVADGYPLHRIEDQLNAVLALTSWSWPFGPV